MKLTIKVVDTSVRLERIGPASAGRACMKREVLWGARKIERKIAGCGNDVRGVCAG